MIPTPKQLRIEALEQRIPHELDNKYNKAFEKQARFLGNDIYAINGLYSSELRELKLMFVAQQEGINIRDIVPPTNG